MNINTEDLEAFVAEAELINQKVKALAENKISAKELDQFEEKRNQDKRKREEMKLKKEKEAYESKVRGREGKGITKDFVHFCRFCHRQYQLDTPKCWKCNRPTMTLAERQAQLQIMVEDYKSNKAKREEKRQKWEMFQKTQSAMWKKNSINYNKKWEYFVEDSDQEPEKEPILPTNDPNFKALQADIEQRKKRRAKDTQNAKRLKQKGNAAMKQGDYQKASQFYTLALEHIKDIKSIYTNRALAFIKLKKYKKAIKDCTNVIEYMEVFEKIGQSKDLMFKALSRRALAKKEIKQYKEALEDITQALKLLSTDNNALLLKKQIQGFIQHTETVEKLIRENKEKESQQQVVQQQKVQEAEEEEEESEQAARKLEKEIVKDLAQHELAQQTEKKSQPQKAEQKIKPVQKEQNPVKEIPKRLQNLNEQNVQYLLHLILRKKELKSLFIASKGIQLTLDHLTKSQSSGNEALLIYTCLEGDGVGERKVWDWGIPKMYSIILSKFQDESKLNLTVYAFVDNLFQILVPMTLSDVYRPQISSDKKTYQFIQVMFPKLITKYKKQPQLLDNFFTFLSNLCSGDSLLKNSYLKAEKIKIIFESIHLLILSHKTKNRLHLDLKQTIFSFFANLVTNSEHRKTFIEFLQADNKLQEIQEELELYPRSAHNFEAYIENVLSVVANAFIDCPLEASSLSQAIFDRYIANWEQYSTTIVHRSLLSVGRIKKTSNKNLTKWLKIFNKMSEKIDPLSNLEDKTIQQVIKILNVVFIHNQPELVTSIPQHLMDLLQKLIKSNSSRQILFCNTCNLFGILLDKKNALTNSILPIVKTIIPKLVEIAKQKVGNWRKSAATLLAKSSFDPKCREQLDAHHGMDVLKSIAPFLIDKK